jgi:N-acetylneuraminic acid mutarotase
MTEINRNGSAKPCKRHDSAEGRKKMEVSMSTNNKPVHKIRYGSVIASIWADNSTSGYFYNTTFCKMPPQQNSWENSGSGRSPIV